MSIAQNNRTGADSAGRRMQGFAIGDLIESLPGYAGEKLHAIEHLDDPKERSRFTAGVLQMMDQFPADGDVTRGRRRKRKILAILEDFARKPPVTIDTPPIVWKYLYAAGSKIAARDEHWDSSCGPLIAASNAKLQKELGWNAARTNLGKLAEWGLAVPYCLSANGKRYFAPGKDGEELNASGWSLAPLLLLEDYLDELSAREELLAEHHMVLPRQIARSTSSAYQLIRPFEIDQKWARQARTKLEAISEARRRYGRRKASRDAVQTLKRLAEAAESLLERVSLRISGAISRPNPDENGTRVSPEQHHQYNPDSALFSVEGLAGRRSGDVPSQSSTKDQAEKKQSQHLQKAGTKEQGTEIDDPLGIERSGFEWSEAPALFPFVDGLIELSESPGLDTLHEVARISQIAQRTAARASGDLGTHAALICALITGQHLANGEIRKTADAYMAALIKRARSGELNLGHSLFGRREAIYGKRDQKASNRVNDMQRLTH